MVSGELPNRVPGAYNFQGNAFGSHLFTWGVDVWIWRMSDTCTIDLGCLVPFESDLIFDFALISCHGGP